MLIPQDSRGFTLLEVLITLLVVSVGVLGIAGLALHSMRASFESGLQSTAALLAVDVHERAWIASHEATTNTCRQDWIDLGTFAPGRDLPGLIATVDSPPGLSYPDCEFTVEWDADVAGVVGRMAGFGGMYTHRFTIPSVQ
jgi:prepilin-type N-terminal cleavage/methylation domain-containing protein